MLSIINPLEYPGWDDLLLSNENYSFFHSSHWARVLHEAYNYKPVYTSLISEGKLNALIPLMEVKSYLTGKRGVSLPFTDYCKPFISDAPDKEYIFSFVKEHAKKNGWKYIEIRGNGGLFVDVPPSSFYYGHTLDLSPGEENIFSGFKSTTQRNIKKALREDLKVRLETSLASIEEFYRLNCMTRKEHGIPPQPFHFFKKIYEHIISKGHGLVALAIHSGRAIAGTVYFHFGPKVLYKYGASDKRYQQLRANNLVMWEAIRHFLQKGYKSLCFGRTEPGNRGLLQFKQGWGAGEHAIKYYKYDLKQNSFVKETSKLQSFHSRIFANMPTPFLKLAGRLLYRHIG